MITRHHVKHKAKKNGWSQRAMARELGRTQTHINLVLNGKRTSKRLLSRIAALPVREKKAS